MSEVKIWNGISRPDFLLPTSIFSASALALAIESLNIILYFWNAQFLAFEIGQQLRCSFEEEEKYLIRLIIDNNHF